jgi:hypothetical protein
VGAWSSLGAACIQLLSFQLQACRCGSVVCSVSNSCSWCVLQVLTITTPEEQEARVQEFVGSMCARARCTYALAGTYKFELPTADVTLSTVFDTMATAATQGLTVLDWGVHSATLEEVFVRLAQPEANASVRDASTYLVARTMPLRQDTSSHLGAMTMPVCQDTTAQLVARTMPLRQDTTSHLVAKTMPLRQDVHSIDPDCGPETLLVRT